MPIYIRIGYQDKKDGKWYSAPIQHGDLPGITTDIHFLISHAHPLILEKDLSPSEVKIFIESGDNVIEAFKQGFDEMKELAIANQENDPVYSD